MPIPNHPLATEPTGLNKMNNQYQIQPGETYMNTQQKEHLREILRTERTYWLERQKKIISDLSQKKVEPTPLDAADIANREVELRSAVRGREYRLIRKIDGALNRLETEGSQYGFCENCSNPIGIQRLEVRPTATLCFDCKTLDEIREQQRGDN